MPTHSLEEVLHPRSIAIVGASDSGRGSSFLSPLIDLGFQGDIYPVNPKYSKIMDLKVYPTIRDIPGPVDYVISAAPAPQVPSIMKDCIQKGVKCIHLFTARFSETGREDAIELENEILTAAREGGVRIIGPNCLGVYYPKMRISFADNFPRESGSTALASQSGQAAREIINTTTSRGLFFNKAISYGNAIDFNECDFLEYFGQDPEITVIMMYIEGPKDGDRFFNILREVTKTKPVVILKGGRGQSGARAVSSHTASLAGSMQIWNTAINQAGAISVSSIEELVDMAVSFHFLPPITSRRVGIFAGGGGATVLAADQCEEAGLDVVALPQEIREELKSQGIQIWDWVSNPIDFSINMGDVDFSPTVLLQMMAQNPNFDFIITTIGGHPGGGGSPHRGGSPHSSGQPQRSATSQQGSRPHGGGGPPWMNQPMGSDEFYKQYTDINDHKPVLGLVPDRSPTIDTSDWEEERWKSTLEMTAKLIELKIPYYPTISRAARAASKLIGYYQRKERYS